MTISDFRVSLHWFARDREWRICADNGDYWTVRELSEIPDAVANLMRAQARELTAATDGP